MHFVRQEMGEGGPTILYVDMSNLFQKAGENMSGEEEFVTKWTAAALYTGGADTVSCLKTEILWLSCLFGTFRS